MRIDLDRVTNPAARLAPRSTWYRCRGMVRRSLDLGSNYSAWAGACIRLVFASRAWCPRPGRWRVFPKALFVSDRRLQWLLFAHRIPGRAHASNDNLPGYHQPFLGPDDLGRMRSRTRSSSRPRSSSAARRARRRPRRRETGPCLAPVGPFVILDFAALVGLVDANAMPPFRVILHAVGRVCDHQLRSAAGKDGRNNRGLRSVATGDPVRPQQPNVAGDRGLLHLGDGVFIGEASRGLSQGCGKF